ncbi:MAG: HAD family hydrolase [Pseudomonadota bacterium]
MVKAVLFDLDETLFDRSRTLPVFLSDQFTRFEAHLGTVERGDWCARFLELDANGRTHKSIVYPELLSTFGGDPEAAPALLDDYYDHSTAKPFAIPGMSTVLSDLRRSGLLCGLITNGETRLQSRTISALGLTDRMDVILISEAEGVRKPDPVIFRRTVERLGVLPNEALYIGDNPEADVWGAANAGLHGVWFNPNGRAWPQHLNPPTETVMTRLTDILALLKIN